MRNFLIAAMAVSAVLIGADASAQTKPGATLCTPKIAAMPITAASQPYRHAGPPPAGYVEEEFSVSCTVGGTPYKSIVHVRRPADAAKASGIVLAEVWHWGDIWTVYPKVVNYLARKGDSVAIIVSSPLAVADIKKKDPKRYADISIPWMPDRKKMAEVTVPQEFEILSQVGALIKSGGVPGLKARKIIMAGMSGSAGQVRRYIAQEGKNAKLNGKSVYDGYFPSETALSMSEWPIPDVDVPVVEIQGETELMRSFEPSGHRAAYRRADGPLYRLYEVPGMSHISTRNNSTESPRGWNCGKITLSDFPQEAVYMAALDNLVNWVDKGTAAPHASRIETNADGSVIMRDTYGNAKGGVRTSYFDVPVASYHVASSNLPQGRGHGTQVQRCDMIGNITPLPSAELKKLYPTHDDYVKKVDASLNGLVAGHWYLPEDAQELRAEAAKAKIP